jgi:Fe2+ transport system protein B
MNQDILDAEEGTPKSNQEILFSTIRNLANVQVLDSEVKKQELQVRSEEIASNERIAMKSIDAQERSHLDNRSQYNKHLIHRYFFVIVALIAIFAFALAMVIYGAKDIIIEAFKIMLAFAGGAFGGFHAGKNKKEPEE